LLHEFPLVKHHSKMPKWSCPCNPVPPVFLSYRQFLPKQCWRRVHTSRLNECPLKGHHQLSFKTTPDVHINPRAR